MDIFAGALFSLPQAPKPGSWLPAEEGSRYLSSKFHQLLAVMALSLFVREPSESHCTIGGRRTGGVKGMKVLKD